MAITRGLAGTESTLLASSNRELDELFRASPAGAAPVGVLDGIAILFPGSPVSRALAAVVRAVAWRGKVIDPDGKGLANRLTPFDIRAIRAVVRPTASLVDGGQCTVLDYSATSFVAGGVRDEIRLVAPQMYLGVVWLWGRRVAWFSLRERRWRPGTTV